VQLENSFHVPLPVDQAWRVLLDAERSVPCMPGARLDSVSGDDCTGSIKVKLGPINLTYQGKASLTEKDEAAHRVVIDARGKDQRGNGSAAAVITATLAADGDATRVDVVTDLTITGRPAQFGRGVMTDVGDKMLTQFAVKLAAQLGAPAPASAARRPAAAAAATATGVVEEIAASVEQVPGEGPAAKVVKKAAAATKKAAASATEQVTAPAAAPAKRSAPARKAAAAKSAPAKAAETPAVAKATPAKQAAPAEATVPTDVAPASTGARRPSGPPKGPSAPPARPATGAPVRSTPSSGPRPAPSTPAVVPARPEPIDLLEVTAGGPGRYAPAVGAAAAVVAVVLLLRRRRRRG
jgi:carbon monoxide dehydrogenase subunit G